MGKSAQILLHTWLPDAMEGPTPVSALIHAATMVTAGVFLVVRCSPIYEYSELALNLITVVGMTTAIFAASVALVQTDIKKIIAYSTCSQLGYMFFAAGVGAYNIAMFHLFTHAFFKALLFLGSGSVIHAFKDEQNINSMGGVWKKITLHLCFNDYRNISSHRLSIIVRILLKRCNYRICLFKRQYNWLLCSRNRNIYSISNFNILMEINL
jgi:NADH:ubiquinone oxidoreductase subunit 5 (subunit L)/multisubunit Na+/H+ antiporter MnhA subunit